MKRFEQLAATPISSPLLADGVFELHAARIVLLLQYCGVNGRIEGLTKTAKLDFFVRYPDFFRRAALALGQEVDTTSGSHTDSSMVRYRYGPWDNRYYHLLSYLESTDLISIKRDAKQYQLMLTTKGKEMAASISENPSYNTLIEHMRDVKKAMGSKAGSTLKKLIYKQFETEIGNKAIGEVIE